MTGHMTTKEIAEILGSTKTTVIKYAKQAGMYPKYTSKNDTVLYTLEQFKQLKTKIIPPSMQITANKRFDTYWKSHSRIMIAGDGKPEHYAPIFDKQRQPR